MHNRAHDTDDFRLQDCTWLGKSQKLFPQIVMLDFSFGNELLNIFITTYMNSGGISVAVFPDLSTARDSVAEALGRFCGVMM